MSFTTQNNSSTRLTAFTYRIGDLIRLPDHYVVVAEDYLNSYNVELKAGQLFQAASHNRYYGTQSVVIKDAAERWSKAPKFILASLQQILERGTDSFFWVYKETQGVVTYMDHPMCSEMKHNTLPFPFSSKGAAIFCASSFFKTYKLVKNETK